MFAKLTCTTWHALKKVSIMRISSTVKDLTLLKQLEQKVDHEQINSKVVMFKANTFKATMFKTTMDSIADAVIATDREGDVQYLNPAAEALIGWQLSEAVGLPIYEVFNIIDAETRRPAIKPSCALLKLKCCDKLV
jgi:PAS domain-containing protein